MNWITGHLQTFITLLLIALGIWFAPGVLKDLKGPDNKFDFTEIGKLAIIVLCCIAVIGNKDWEIVMVLVTGLFAISKVKIEKKL